MLTQRIAEKRQARAAVVAQIRAISDRTKAAGSTSAEDRTLWDKGEADIAKLDEEIRTLEADLERERRLATLSAEAPRPQQPEVGREKILVEGRAAWSRFLRGGFEALDPEQRAAMRAAIAEGRTQQADIATSGGYMLTPMTFAEEVIKTVDNMTFMRRRCRVMLNVGAEGLGAIELSSRMSRAQRTTELSVGNINSLSVGRRELKPKSLGTVCQVSRKLLGGSPNAEQIVRDEIAYSIAQGDEQDMLTGNGVNCPLGIFTASADGIPTSRDVSTGNTTGSIQFDGLMSAIGSVKQQYRMNAIWAFHRDAVTQVRKLKDGNGQYLWQPSTQAGQPDRLLNYPIEESEYIPNTFTTGLYVGVFGDFSNYWIVNGLNLELRRLEELKALEDSVLFMARMTDDGAPVRAEAFARVKLA